MIDPYPPWRRQHEVVAQRRRYPAFMRDARHMTSLTCRCGSVELQVEDAPIMCVECCCSTCRTAGRQFEQLSDARPVLTSYGATPYAMYRKDRVVVRSGADQLREHRLYPEDRTRRVVAVCCSTPMFLEFLSGHWFSIYAQLWPTDIRPAMQLRTMCRSVEPDIVLPSDLPNPRTHSIGFMLRLLGAFVAMRLRRPATETYPRLDV